MIKELLEPSELTEAFAILKELRPHLDFESFLYLLEESKVTDCYKLFGLYEDKKLLTVMGLRHLADFCHGRHVYIDDLVTTESARSRGHGAQLLAYAETYAKEKGMFRVRLSSGVDMKDAHRFYEREGFELRSVTFKKKL